METNFQDAGNNCFTCHGYSPSTPLSVSHIYSTLVGTPSAAKK